MLRSVLHNDPDKKKKKAIVKLKLNIKNHKQILKKQLSALMIKPRRADRYRIGALDCRTLSL